MADHNDNRLLGNAKEPRVSIIKKPESVGLINNKFKKVTTIFDSALTELDLCMKCLWKGSNP